VHAEVKSFSERSPIVVGFIGLALIVSILIAALTWRELPLVAQERDYSAHFEDAGGLLTGAAVEVSGLDAGSVDSIELDGSTVVIKFSVADDVRIGERSEVAIRTKSLLGAKVLVVTPRGEGSQQGVIPLDRTTSPYQLPDALGDLSATISGLNTDQLSDSLKTLADTFKDTPDSLGTAIDGVARFSETLAKRDTELRNLLADANKTTAVLAQRSDQIVELVHFSNALLAELRGQSAALQNVSSSISAVSTQLKGFIEENKDTFGPMLEKLNGVLAIVDNRKVEVSKSIELLNNYALALGESVSSGPFFKAYISNLLPGQFVQPFIDAAFSDLGLDPAVLLPSQLNDPGVGQPATPALPSPYPRTGQGGDPRLTLPDAITGKPGDPRYPYRQPPPAPEPGGPAPGPPAGHDPAATPPGLAPILHLAPGEVPAHTAPAEPGGDLP
jgi:phospholipid/cholesterol/gamma-HCH transport system substrate-binding protein